MKTTIGIIIIIASLTFAQRSLSDSTNNFREVLGNWEIQNTNTGEAINAITMYPDSIGIAVAGHGTILKTVDGYSWERTVFGTAGLTSVEHLGNSVWAAGENGTVIFSTDKGANWVNRNINTSSRLNGISILNDSTLVVCSEGGAIYKTTNFGEVWIQKQIANVPLRAVDFSNQEQGYVVGGSFNDYYGIVFKTNDLGETWTFLTILEWIGMGVDASDVNNVKIAAVKGYIYTSINGGISWDFQRPTDQWLYNIKNLGDNKWIAIGGNVSSSYITLSNNGGISWNTSLEGYKQWLYGIDNIGNKVWTAGYNGAIIYANSPVAYTPVELMDFKVEIENDKALLSWITVTETNNRGFTVQKKMGDFWEDITFINGKINSTEVTYYSFNDNIQDNNGKIDYRLKQIDTDGSENYSEVFTVENIITDYQLQQNYPNPFNPNTTIRFSIPIISEVKLEVFDMLGNQVKTLVNENKQPGSYTINFDASGLSSGTYFYKLNTAGKVLVKKMIVLK